MEPIRTIEWVKTGENSLIPGHARMVDQTQLPDKLIFIDVSDIKEMWSAIKTLQIRGAPAIGIAGAMGIVLAAQSSTAKGSKALIADINSAADYLASSRPTAVNLFYALDRMKLKAQRCSSMPIEEIKNALAGEAINIFDEDISMCLSIGKHGAGILRNARSVLTHCNAGGLATSQYGTALAPIYKVYEQGQRVRVYVDETRPLLQGARLTAWELLQAGVDVTLICDNTVGCLMKEGHIDMVMVGADRIAANGDTANKIGTYGIAILADAHDIPFYVLAPSSTFDFSLHSGSEIPIEKRGADEVIRGFGKLTAPEKVHVYSPAFDVTPASLITAIICEKGILRSPFESSLQKAAGQS